MLKGFRIKGVDGGWLHIEETENLDTVRICVDHGDAQSSVWLDKTAFEDFLDVRYKLEVHYSAKKEDKEVQDGAGNLHDER